MKADAVRRYLLDFQERTFTGVKRREIRLGDTPKIHTVIGARRVGKTYLLFNKVIELEAAGIKRSQIVYLNFESPVLSQVKYDELRDVLELHWSLFPETMKQRLYVFIDEPQTMERWEIAVRDIQDSFDCRLFLTGSSSKLLSREISTSLRGRAVTTLLLPLSFREFVEFRGLAAQAKNASTKTRALLASYLEEYLQFGGYPEVVLEDDRNLRLKAMKDYLDLTIYKDLIERYNVKNTQLVRWLVDYAVSSAARELSLHKIFSTLKSKGMKVSKNTLYEYFSMLEDSFFVFLLRKFSHSAKEEGASMPKAYLDDVGFLNLFSLEEHGKRMENIVFLELARKRNENPLLNVNYWKSADGKEVDFITSEGKKVKSAIQVCYDISDGKTRERELNALVSCLKRFGLKGGLVITKDEQGEESMDGKTIRFITLLDWLLEK